MWDIVVYVMDLNIVVILEIDIFGYCIVVFIVYLYFKDLDELVGFYFLI